MVLLTGPEGQLEGVIKRLKEKHYRITPQRLAVIKILADSEDHPTVEQVYDRVKTDFPMTSLATIYKTVTLLKDMGEILELGFGDDRNHYDGNKPYPHPHLICLKCKSIIDPKLSMLNDLSQEMSEQTGYVIINHRLDFFGICPLCQDSIES